MQEIAVLLGRSDIISRKGYHRNRRIIYSITTSTPVRVDMRVYISRATTRGGGGGGVSPGRNAA